MGAKATILLRLVFVSVLATACSCSPGNDGAGETQDSGHLLHDAVRVDNHLPNNLLDGHETLQICRKPAIVMNPVLFSGYRFTGDPMQPLYNSCTEAGVASIQLQIYLEDGTLVEHGSYACDDSGIVVPLQPGRYMIGARAERLDGDEVLTRGWIGQYCQEMNPCSGPADPGSPLCDPTCFVVEKCGAQQKTLELFCNELESPPDDACGF